MFCSADKRWLSPTAETMQTIWRKLTLSDWWFLFYYCLGKIFTFEMFEQEPTDRFDRFANETILCYCRELWMFKHYWANWSFWLIKRYFTLRLMRVFSIWGFKRDWPYCIRLDLNKLQKWKSQKYACWLVFIKRKKNSINIFARYYSWMFKACPWREEGEQY